MSSLTDRDIIEFLVEKQKCITQNLGFICLSNGTCAKDQNQTNRNKAQVYSGWPLPCYFYSRFHHANDLNVCWHSGRGSASGWQTRLQRSGQSVLKLWGDVQLGKINCKYNWAAKLQNYVTDHVFGPLRKLFNSQNSLSHTSLDIHLGSFCVSFFTVLEISRAWFEKLPHVWPFAITNPVNAMWNNESAGPQGQAALQTGPWELPAEGCQTGGSLG